ncbi:MAG TPA: TIGR03960 family B12-binding radical SAM protein [Polyangiaceae bacterium]|nr:TIGR03960 family B12-binding radical SAM protein [Polyangiaceae bacterium]
MTLLGDHPYRSFLSKVAKPTRYTGAEHGVRRKDWSSVAARVCLAFPDIYDIGMSHLGFRILYKILNDDPRTLAERCYTPWVDMQKELLAHGKHLVSLESARPLCDFDVLGFSLQYELTYTNILTMLDLGGVPLRSCQRSDDDPLVIAGGPVATHAEPMAPFFDAILIGDGEEAATEIALSWVEGKRKRLSREERLLELAKIRGVYVPSLYRTELDADTGFEVVVGGKHPDAPFPIERRLLDDLAKFPFPDDGPVGGPEAIFDRMSVEVARGCTEGCRFCQAGMIYRPVRERSPEEIVRTVKSALEKSGQDEVSLTALSTADVSCISPLIKRLVEETAPERVSLSVASLRAYGLGEDLLDDMRKVRASGLTFAPEAGTQRMRDVINKNVTEEQLLDTAQRVFSRGFDKMKLYFIIGLPTEEDEDVLGIVSVGANALAVGKRVGKYPRVTVSVSTHVPKPHTPFQWCAQDSLDEVRRKQGILRDAARRVKGLTLRLHDSSTSVLEGVLARGDRRLANVIEDVYLGGGRFDSWEDQLRSDLWQAALERHQIPIEAFLGTIPTNARLPWDHFDIGLEEGFLLREYRKALAGRASPPCGKVAGSFIHATNVRDAEAETKRLVCYDCGVACDLGKMRSERIHFLRAMGAIEPGQRARLPVLNAPPKAPAKPIPQDSPEAFRPEREGLVRRFRLRFEKTGAAALLGHLDLIRELPRAVRRAGARTAYTRGFHPKPDMTFSPALSLGVASLDEYLDIGLVEPPEPAELIARLERAASGGLRFLSAVPLEPKDPSVSAIVDAGRYLIAFAEQALKPIGGRQGLEQRVQAFLDKAECVVRRDVDGIGKMVDVRRFTQSARLGDIGAEQLLLDAGLRGALVPLEVTMRITQNGSAKIGEVVEAIFGEKAFPYQAVRVALLAGDKTPLDVAAFRKPKPQTESIAAAPA